MEEHQRTAHSHHLHTRCGRAIRVARFAPRELPAEMGRVVLDTLRAPYDDREVWASLTPEEARQLAGLLLSEAKAVESRGRACEPHVAVVPLSGDAFEVTVRGHALRIDQPLGEGGQDTGPTPVEMFVASLATCVAHYAGRFLDRHGLDRGALRVTADHTMAADRPARVATLTVDVHVPELPPARAGALEAVASHCTVENTLQHPPTLMLRIHGSGSDPRPVHGSAASGDQSRP
ncbi:OsmC family protein [Streptomyces wuyuanensis]|uniref:OsmC family protein n=1 Tax=Streptomyces wuyuanensis TaxID=1196353 RepID=UPI003D71CBD9